LAVENIMINAVNARGEGVAVRAGQAVTLPFTLPGETIEHGPDLDDALLQFRIVKPSPNRVVPICQHYTQCGGCVVQHWSDPPYFHWKAERVRAVLADAGLSPPMAALIDAHAAGRRRVTLHLREKENGVVAGFMRMRSHELIDIDHCPLLVPELAKATGIARAFAPLVQTSRKPIDVQITAATNGLDVDLRGSGPIDEPLRRRLGSIAIEQGLARLTLHGEIVMENAAPEIMIGKAKVELPPGSFLQATEAGEQALAKLVLDVLPQSPIAIADLFCGLGAFALRMAETHDVSAFDTEKRAIASLGKASGQPGLRKVKALVRDLTRHPLALPELKDFGAVVFDPPRAGAESQSRQLARSDVPLVVAVSCQPETLARDLKILTDGSYTIEQVTPVDQFRWSQHVETVAVLKKAAPRKRFRF
jgi:23S rRNA (uracil1939-C5)-methyltransferase